MPLLGFIENAGDAGLQGRTRIDLELERRRFEVVANPRCPPCFDGFEIEAFGVSETVQESDIVLHVAHAATTGAAALRRQHFGDAVVRKDGLDGGFTEAQDLSLSGCDQLCRIQRKAVFDGSARDDQCNAKRSLVAEKLMR